MRGLLNSVLLMTQLTQATQRLGFVYELVRHGARAPIIPEPEGAFNVGVGLLTETGMRQRYALGRFNRQRYIEREQLLDEVYNPAQLYVQSTGVDRTLQSTYSELQGLYYQNTNKPVPRGWALPPLKVRSANTIKSDFLERYSQVPVFSFLEKTTPLDDIQPGGCLYAYTFNSDHWNKEATYEEIADFILPVLREPVGKAFGV